MTWRTGTPPQGEWLIIDRVWRFRRVAIYNPAVGWVVDGRVLGHDGAEAWHALPDTPLQGDATWPYATRNHGPRSDPRAASSPKYGRKETGAGKRAGLK
jgi:hypothetical protein